MQKTTASYKRRLSFYWRMVFHNFNLAFTMKASTCIILSMLLSAHLLTAKPVMGQKMEEKKITLELRNVTLLAAIKKVEKVSGFRFAYSPVQLSKYGNIQLARDNRTVLATLQSILPPYFTLSQEDNVIIISQKAIKINATEIQSVLLSSPPVEINGRVLNERGEPMAGVTVTIKGTKRVTATDQNGFFRLNVVSMDAILVFTAVNIESSIELKADQAITDKIVRVKSKISQLDEVQVIGYGTTTKRKSTGLVSSVTSDDIAKQPVANPLNALQGRVAGAVITQSNGLPGSSVSILIRGISTLGNGTIPLYIVDGVPFNINDQAIPATNNLNSYGITAANGGISPFSMINPADIERIDVLKDADVTAIYGTRAANGVILITTKKAKAGKTKLDLNYYQGIGKVAHYIDMLNLPQYLALRKKAFSNDGITATAANAPDFFTYDSTRYTDWQKKYMGGSAMTTDAQATVSGGDFRTKFLLGAGYHRETTVFPGSMSDQRLSVRFNADHNSLDRKFYAGVSAIYSYDQSNLISTDLSSTYSLPPDYKLYNSDGTLFWDANYTNPEARFLQKYIGKTNNLISNGQLRYTVIPGLDLKTSLSFSKVGINQNQQTPANSQNPTSSPTNNARFATVDQQSYTVEPQATYTKKVSKGILAVLAGATWQRSLNTTTSITATGYSNPNLLASVSGAASYTPTGTYTLYKYNSFFGRINYQWKETYILNGNIRKDGSSRFGPAHRFGTFGSVGAAWVFSNEDFIKKAFPFLSFGKLRASYGITGNDQFLDYQFLSTLSTGSATYAYQGTSILYPSIIANPDLHWETNKKMEIGIDLGFINDRILLTADYYRNRSDNQLSYLSLPYQTGFNSYSGNFPALIQNKGFEFELNTKNIVGKEFSWKTSFNFTIPQNRLLKVDPTYFYASTYKLGNSINQQLRYMYKGVDPLTGKPLYLNAVKDSLTFVPNYSTDRSLVGDTDPKWYGGISNDFQYKGWSFSFFVQFTKRYGNIYPTGTPGVLGNVPGYWLSAGMWQQPGDQASAPKATTNTSIYGSLGSSNFAWGDNSFVKLKNISLSYSLPSHWLNAVKMSNCRLYAQAQNVLTWSKNKIAFDPETGTSMPPLRVITFGINCSF